jgi:hypothetical protein
MLRTRDNFTATCPSPFLINLHAKPASGDAALKRFSHQSPKVNRAFFEKFEMLNLAPNQNAISILASATYFLAALIFAHLALAAAEILALAAALIVFLNFLAEVKVGLVLLIFAHLAFCAARIFSMPAALIFLRVVFTSVTVLLSTVRDSLINSSCSSAICSLTCAARLNCDGVR